VVFVSIEGMAGPPFEAASLTPSRLVQLAPEETQVASAMRVRLVDRDRRPFPTRTTSKTGGALPLLDGLGFCAISTHHLYWIPPEGSSTQQQSVSGTKELASGSSKDEKKGMQVPAAVKVPLSRILKADAHHSIFRRDPRIDLYFAEDPSTPLLRIIFSTQADSHECFGRLQASLAREGWKAPKMVVQREEGFNTQFAGVGGVMRRQEREREQTATLTSEAFSDLEQLMQSASEIVTLADRFSAAVRAKQARQHQQQRQQQQSSDGKKEEEEDFFSILNDMGIANPATKRACGSRYHTELAKELADFLSIHLKRHSKTGAMPLTDLYALVNRARGTELISPNDLYQACLQMKPLGLGFEFKTFESGVAILQSTSLNDDMVAKRIISLFEAQIENGSSRMDANLSAVELAAQSSVTLQLAFEQLQMAEERLLLCRDESVRGVFFFLNLFDEFLPRNDDAKYVAMETS